MVDERGLLEDRFKARDLPLNRIKPLKDAQEALAQFDEAQAAASQIQQGLDTSKTQKQLADAQLQVARAQEVTEMLKGKVEESLSRIAQNLAKAKGVKDGTALQSIQLLLDQVKTEGAGGGADGKAPKKAADK